MSSAGTGFAIRLAVFFSALFLTAGVKLPYLPVWLDWRGLTAAEIATITAAPLFLRIVATPALALVADRWGDHRGMVVTLAWCSAALICLLALVQGFWAILGVTLLMALATMSIMPLTETIAMAGVRRTGADYGRMRLWGSLSFIFASSAAGLVVTSYGAGAIAWILIATGFATLAAAHLLPRAESHGARPDNPPIRRAVLADALALVSSRPFLLFLAAVGAIQGAHAVFYTFGVLHWRKLGYSDSLCGMLWAIGVIAEIGLFAFSGAVVRRVGALSLVLIGGAASIIRWIAMAWDPPLALLLPLQALHGLTYGATHLGAVHLMSETVPPEQSATAQAIYASITAGVAMGLATLVAGQLYPAAGGWAYISMAVLAVIGMAAALLLAQSRAQPQSSRGGGAIRSPE